jgi:hypothetical protein
LIEDADVHARPYRTVGDRRPDKAASNHGHSLVIHPKLQSASLLDLELAARTCNPHATRRGNAGFGRHGDLYARPKQRIEEGAPSHFAIKVTARIRGSVLDRTASLHSDPNYCELPALSRSLGPSHASSN